MTRVRLVIQFKIVIQYLKLFPYLVNIAIIRSLFWLMILLWIEFNENRTEYDRYFSPIQNINRKLNSETNNFNSNKHSYKVLLLSLMTHLWIHSRVKMSNCVPVSNVEVVDRSQGSGVRRERDLTGGRRGRWEASRSASWCATWTSTSTTRCGPRTWRSSHPSLWWVLSNGRSIPCNGSIRDPSSSWSLDGPSCICK